MLRLHSATVISFVFFMKIKVRYKQESDVKFTKEIHESEITYFYNVWINYGELYLFLNFNYFLTILGSKEYCRSEHPHFHTFMNLLLHWTFLLNAQPVTANISFGPLIFATSIGDFHYTSLPHTKQSPRFYLLLTPNNFNGSTNIGNTKFAMLSA